MTKFQLLLVSFFSHDLITHSELGFVQGLEFRCFMNPYELGLKQSTSIKGDAFSKVSVGFRFVLQVSLSPYHHTIFLNRTDSNFHSVPRCFNPWFQHVSAHRK